MPTIFNQNNVKKQGKFIFGASDDLLNNKIFFSECGKKLGYIISWAFLAQLIQVYLCETHIFIRVIFFTTTRRNALTSFCNNSCRTTSQQISKRYGSDNRSE